MQAVDNHLAHRQIKPFQLAEQHPCHMNAQGLGQHDGHEAALARRLQQRAQVRQVGHGLFQIEVDLIFLISALVQPRQVAMFGQHRIQGGDPLPHDGRQTQQSQGMPGRRGVHHNAGMAILFDPGRNLKQGHDFIQTGHREVEQMRQVSLIQKCPAQGNAAQMLFVSRLEPKQTFLGVKLTQGQILKRRRAGKTIDKGMGRVGRDQQEGASRMLTGQVQSGSSSTGGLADPAFATEEQQAKLVYL